MQSVDPGRRAGAAGAAGPAGTAVLNGVVPPAAGVGNNGDFYIDTVTSLFYGPKAGGAWPAGHVITGYAATISLSTVTAAIASGGSLDLNLVSWINRGMVVSVVLKANAASLQTLLEFYSDDAFTPANLMYRAGLFDAFTSDFKDYVPWYWNDSDVSAEVHVRITNNGTVASTYDLDLIGMGS